VLAAVTEVEWELNLCRDIEIHPDYPNEIDKIKMKMSGFLTLLHISRNHAHISILLKSLQQPNYTTQNV
jgi:hypothetical protein